MPLKRTGLVTSIFDQLVDVAKKLSVRAKHNYNDGNVSNEPFVARLLNLVHSKDNWQLVNLNEGKSNYPAADLGDWTKRIAVQVTIRKDRNEKIRDAHEKAIKHNLADEFDKLIVFFFSDDGPQPKAELLEPAGSLTFESWDLENLRKQIENLDVPVLEEIHQLLGVELTRWIRQRISNVHEQINERRLFVGREEILQQLKDTLRSAVPAAITQSQAIHAAGGVGKTQLALEFAERHRDDYDLIWWVRAETRSTALSDLAKLAEPMELIAPGAVEADLDKLVAAVVGTLAQRERWLLIFDNAESPESLIKLLPSGTGHILLTTRNPNWGQLARPFPLDLMTLEEAKDLLRQRSGMSDPAAEEQIARRLGRLPLALEIAGAYCAATGMPLADYVPLLEQIGVPLLDEHLPVDYHSLLSKTWLPSFEKACAECPEAEKAINLLACMAPDNFPISLLEPTLGGKLQLNAAIAALRRYSLVERAGDLASMHRLLQEVLREMRNDATRQEWLGRAVRIVDSALPVDIQTDLQSWPLCEQLFPHAACLAVLITDKDVNAAEPTGRLLSVMGTYKWVRAQHHVAEPLMRRVVTIFEKSNGESHPSVATALNNLAQLQQTANRPTEAEPLLRRALTILSQSFGTHHPNFAILLNNLATLLLDTNRLKEAEPLMREAMSILEKSRGEDDPEVATVLNGLSGLLQLQNRLAEAEPLIRRALAIDEQKYGAEHPTVARDIHNLAALLKATNRAADAEPLMCRALAIDEQAYGAEHPNVATRLNNLASLLQSTNRLTEAEPLMRRALAIDEQSYGLKHPNVARDLNNLALLLLNTDRLMESELLMRRALAIDELAFGPDHPNLAIDLNNLAQLLQATSRLAEAEPLMRRALAIHEQSYGAQHPSVAIALNNISGLLQSTNRLEEAESLMRRHLEILCQFTRTTSHKHPHLRSSIDNYWSLLEAMQIPEAEREQRLLAAGVDLKWFQKANEET